MVDDFFEGALEGCGAIAGIGMAIVGALLFVQILFSPIFWILAGAGLIVWIVFRLVAPAAAEKKPPLLSYPPPAPMLATSAGVAPPAAVTQPERTREARERSEIRDLLTPVPLVFAAGEPSVFDPPEIGVPYRGHAAAKKRLDRAIASVPRDGGLRALLVGRAGIGRGTLAKITAARLQARQQGLGIEPGSYYVVPAARIRSSEQLDLLVRRLRPRDIVYLEDLDRLQRTVGVEPLLALFVVAENGNPPVESESGAIPRTISWIASTRLAGRVDEVLRRALRPQVRLRDPSPDVLVEILGDREMVMHPDAAYEIAERTAPYPAQALALYAEAKEFALGEESDLIQPGHVRDAVEVLGVEE